MNIEQILLNIHANEISDSGANLEDLRVNDPQRFSVALLSIFSYNVVEGGFAKLIYYLQGEYLEEMGHVLHEINARYSEKMLNKAVVLCVDNLGEYHPFMENDFSDCEFKKKLDAISLDYFGSNKTLVNQSKNEITDLLKHNGYQ
jgi:hypothetical protein